MTTVIFQALQKNKTDALLLSSDSARRYVTGLSLSEGFVFLCQGQIFPIVDFRYIEAAKKGKSMTPILLEGSITDCLFSLCEKFGVGSLGYEEDHLTAEQYFRYMNALEGITLLPSAGLVKNLRMAKSTEELSYIKKAQQLTDRTFAHIVSFVKPGVAERELQLEIDYFIRKNGGTSAFDTIVLTGKNTSMPHGVPGDDRIKEGDFVLFDFGAAYDGYKSDMTRTLAVSFATEEMKKVYETVRQAQTAALTIIKSGITGREADKAARDIIDATEYKGTFGHSLGHGVGLEIHEQPNFSPKNENSVPHGAVMSVEPGIYLEGRFGVRIEDLVVVKKDGIENLTKSPKELIIL